MQAMQTQEFYPGTPEAIASVPDSLKDMALWSAANPPLEGWRNDWGHDAAPKVVHLHPHVKFTIHVESARDMAYGLDRDDALAELGVFGSELDSRNFAQSLLKCIEDHLSIRNLKHLSDVFAQALANEEAHRARHATSAQGDAATASGD
jgi:hypothetical protein